jgi:CubicO group peptidase (beta-lactamase class C family)
MAAVTVALGDDVPAALARVRERFAERHAKGAAPSVAYGVVAGGGLVDNGGFGDVDGHGTPPTADTAYRLASVTKSFTAATMLVLRDRGALSLDAPITDFVAADLRLPTPDSPVPTLRMLATMSSGLPSDDPWADRQEALTDAQFDELLRAGVRFAWVPGTAFEYSNLGYALLGRALQVAGRRRYHDLVVDEVVAPLGLGSTSFTADVAAAGGTAIGHRRVGGAWVPLPFSGAGAFSPIGGLFSTVTDLARWIQFFVDAHRGDDAGPLTAASRREMQQGYRLIPPDPSDPASPDTGAYGFGLFAEYDPAHGAIVSHAGEYPGFSAYIGWHPATGMGIVALENATYAGVSRPAAAALRDLLDATAARPASEPWPETLAAQESVMRLLHRWDEALGDELFSDNVALDEPLGRRRAAIARVLARAGPLGAVDQEGGNGPADRSWRIRGEHADVRCRIAMNPQHPPRVQTVEVRLEQRRRPKPAGGSPAPR